MAKKTYELSSWGQGLHRNDQGESPPDAWEPKAPKNAQWELQMDEAKPKTEATTIKKMVLALGTTKGKGARYHGYPVSPAKQIMLKPTQLPEEPKAN